MRKNQAKERLTLNTPNQIPLGSHINSLAVLKEYIRADFRSRGGDGSFVRRVLFDPVARFTILMRVLEYIDDTSKPAIIRVPFLLWYRRLSVRLGFSFAPGIFGPGLAIVHYGLLIIDPGTRVGRNCRIHAGVNIGGAARILQPGEVDCYSPRIGHEVYIGPGAKLYGPIEIGDRSTIGANAVVTRSFPECDVVLAGVPAKVIKRQSSSDLLIKGAG